MPRGDPWPDLRGNQSSICAIVLTGEVSDWNERSDSVEERSLRERCFVGSLGWGLGLALPSQGELMRSPWPWPWRAVCLASGKMRYERGETVLCLLMFARFGSVPAERPTAFGCPRSF